MAKLNIEYPKNLTMQGVLAFPIKSEDEIEQLKEWRAKKGIRKPKYPDKIGGNLLITQAQYDRVVEYLEKVYMPFLDVLYKESNGTKGLPPEITKTLNAQVKKRDWSGSNFPIRELSDKDRENNPDSDFVAKIKFAGPYEADLGVKAIVKQEDGTQLVTTISSLIEDGLLPENTDTTRLWWGSGWHYRVSLRFNGFEAATGEGVTAYSSPHVYLLPHLGLPTFGTGGADASVIEDGDDWEE